MGHCSAAWARLTAEYPAVDTALVEGMATLKHAHKLPWLDVRKTYWALFPPERSRLVCLARNCAIGHRQSGTEHERSDEDDECIKCQGSHDM